jgi:protein-disulfide isomerase-like protein with CxxC motif
MGRKLTGAAAIAAVLAVLAVLAGCGSSKPAYCSSLTDLKQSVEALPTTDVVQHGTDALKTNVNKAVNNAHAVVDAAKHDFPTETTAITDAANSLKTTVNQLGQNASPTLVVQAAGNVASLGSAVRTFSSSASSKCS